MDLVKKITELGKKHQKSVFDDEQMLLASLIDIHLGGDKIQCDGQGLEWFSEATPPKVKNITALNGVTSTLFINYQLT